MDWATRFVRAQGKNQRSCLLDILDCVHGAVEFRVHWSAVMSLAIAQLHFGDRLRDVVGYLPEQH